MTLKASKCHQLDETQDWLLERKWQWWFYFKMQRKKESWSSKIYEMIKWSFRNATLVIEILLLRLHTLTCWWLYWNSWWCANNTELVYLLSQTYFNWGTKWLFDCRNKYIWKLSSICVICNTTCARLSRHWMDFLKT